MKLLGFDIETYREHFVLVAQLWDSDTKTMIRETRVTDDGKAIDRARMALIHQLFNDCDYIISFNGKRFDLPVLAKITSDLKRSASVPLKYIYQDAKALIEYDANNNPIVKRHCRVEAWNAKHFDMLNNCLLRYSLKQWEMYEGLRIRELPYDPMQELTDAMKAEIDDYCSYDVSSMMHLFWKYGFDKARGAKVTLIAQKALLQWWPKHLPFVFDRTTQQITAGIIYDTLGPLPPKSNQPLALFDINEFKVPTDIKLLIGYIAKAPSIEFETIYKGIQFGKGGAHYIVPGHHRNVYAFDFASLYAYIIARWQLLKTPTANKRYSEKRDYRVNEVKHKKKDNPELQNVDRGLKLFLNAPSGAFRIKSAYSTMFDPAAGEAMCDIGQLLISELAFACPEFKNLIEINTDSVFVVGDANIKACREMIGKMHERYGLVLEEEFMPEIYVRDVNNYLIYDENGELTGGKGTAYSDIINKNSNIAMYKILFKSLIKPTVEANWSDFGWKDFVVKYHKSAASKYASIDNKPMAHKNYYFMWTTRDCPDSVVIGFSRELFDRKSGAIKMRWGVWSQDMAELAKYAPYIDYTQYRRDLDAELLLWHREDLITTHLDKYQRKTCKSLQAAIERGLL
jgi:predicted PolB exonuclease-like 3'-5' exonuclease